MVIVINSVIDGFSGPSMTVFFYGPITANCPIAAVQND